MNSLLLFNPANDLALAANQENYTAPRAAQLLQRAGEALPLWYGNEGDKVMCYGINASWIDAKLRDFKLGTDVYNHSDLLQPDPWGWSKHAKRIFALEGLPSDVLPSDQWLETYRQLSHRRTAAMISERLMLRCKDPDYKIADSNAFEATDINQIKDILNQCGDAVLKSPWSSSGRGVLHVAQSSVEKAIEFANGTIHRQGSVMVERYFDKCFDLARIYSCADGKCSSIGTSVFTAGANGKYEGNILADEATLLDVVDHHYPKELFESLCEELRQILEAEIAPKYDGILGVDMLVDAQGRIDPVVEINLRHTMGWVAIKLSDRLLMPGATGRFSVIPHSSMAEKYEAIDGRMVSGRLLLTPSNPNFDFEVTID